MWIPINITIYMPLMIDQFIYSLIVCSILSPLCLLAWIRASSFIVSDALLTGVSANITSISYGLYSDKVVFTEVLNRRTKFEYKLLWWSVCYNNKLSATAAHFNTVLFFNTAAHVTIIIKRSLAFLWVQVSTIFLWWKLFFQDFQHSSWLHSTSILKSI